MYQYVLFDLDGTLTDSAPGIWASLRHALETIGAPQPADELLRAFIGPPLHDSMRNLLHLNEADTEACYRAYRERYTRVGWSENTPFEGVGELVAELREQGVRLAVATSKPEPTAIRILEHFGLAADFEFIAGASEDGSRRTKAAVVRRALDALGVVDVEPGQVILVGDRLHDTEGAAEHGVDCVLVTWGYGEPDEHAAAKYSVATVGELRAVLNGTVGGTVTA